MVHNLQVLRGIAALMVVFHHGIIQLPAVEARLGGLTFGQLGVDVFFVISGFVIYLSASKPDTEARTFLLDRLIRVVPLYWFFTLLLAGLALSLPSLFRSTVVAPDTLLKSLFFIPHHSLAFPERVWPVLVPGWSLNYEMLFYALCAMVLVLAPRHILGGISLAIGSLVIAGFFIESSSPIIQTYTNVVLLEFLGGVVLAALFVRNGFSGRLALAVALPIGLVLLLLPDAMALTRPMEPAVAIVGAIAVVAGLLGLEANGWKLTGRVGRVLGDASYSIYLSHIFALGLVRVFWTKAQLPADSFLGAILFILVALVVSAVIGIATYYLIERPALKWMRTWTRPSNQSHWHPQSQRHQTSH